MVPDTIAIDGIMCIYSLQPHISNLVRKIHPYPQLWWSNIPVSCFFSWLTSTESLVESKWCHYIMVEADSHLPSHIHLRHIQSVWAHWYAVCGHMVAAIHSYTNTTWLIFWGSGSLEESKWCHYIMVEADSHLKLLPTFILDIYKVFEHIDMLSMGI